MTTIDLTVHKDRRARAIQRAKERNIIIPTYAQMKDPSKIPAKIKEELTKIGLWDIHPRNLFRLDLLVVSFVLVLLLLPWQQQREQRMK